MLIDDGTLKRIMAGEVRRVFRRWRRPTVKAGTLLRTARGVVRIDGVESVEAEAIPQSWVDEAGFADATALLRETDRKSRGGTLFAIRVAPAGPDPRWTLRAQTELSDAEVETIRKRLSRLDRSSPDGPWTGRLLDAIAAHPERPARELAAPVDMPLDRFKRRVRQLKELGLTESLSVGYRLSPRGRAWRARRDVKRGGEGS